MALPRLSAVAYTKLPSITSVEPALTSKLKFDATSATDKNVAASATILLDIN